MRVFQKLHSTKFASLVYSELLNANQLLIHHRSNNYECDVYHHRYNYYVIGAHQKNGTRMGFAKTGLHVCTLICFLILLILLFFS